MVGVIYGFQWWWVRGELSIELGWFVGFNGGRLWILVDGFDIDFEINGF